MLREAHPVSLMPPEPKRGGNLVRLAAAKFTRLAAGLGVNVMLMRALGVEGFGVYGYVMTLVGLASFGAGLGMDRLIVRDLSREPDSRGPMVATGLTATVGLAVVTALGIIGWATLIDGRPHVVHTATLAAIATGVLALARVPEAAFHADRTMGPATKGQMAGRIALVVTTAIGLWAGLGLYAVFVGQLVDSLVVASIIGGAYVRWQGRRGLATSLSKVRALVRRSLPFGLQLLFGSIYLSVDVLLIEMICGDTEVGVYRGAVMLISLFPVIAVTLTTGYFPRMARKLGDPKGAGEELSFIVRVLLAISVPAAVGGMLTAEALMVFLGGSEFAVSAAPFIVMAPLLPLRFVNNALATTLSTLDRQRDRTRGVFLAAILNLGLNLAVIPHYGAVGAAATTLATEVALLSWNRWRVGPIIAGLTVWGPLLRIGVAVCAMAAALRMVPSLHVVVDIGFGVVVYAVVGVLVRAFHPSDLRRLRKV